MTNTNHSPLSVGSNHRCNSPIEGRSKAKSQPLTRSLKTLGHTVANIPRKRVLIHARVSVNAAGQVVEAARDKGVSVSEFVRQAIAVQVANAGGSRA